MKPFQADIWNLSRFLTAQASVFDDVCEQLRRGHKTSHWMWFVFPQLKALGRSETAKFYGIADASEAQAYLEHEVLGPRLRHCCALLLASEGRTADEIFGSIDAMKLRSSMTLFACAAGQATGFQRVLDKFYRGLHDEATLALLKP